MQTFLYVLHFLVCFILIGVVLLQRGKGQDLGASLGGGSANTIFGSRGAGNFLTRITTASAIIFMGTSLSLSYLGYTSSDVRLFDESEPFVPEGSAVPAAQESGLEEIPAAAADAEEGGAGRDSERVGRCRARARSTSRATGPHPRRRRPSPDAESAASDAPGFRRIGRGSILEQTMGVPDRLGYDPRPRAAVAEMVDAPA